MNNEGVNPEGTESREAEFLSLKNQLKKYSNLYLNIQLGKNYNLDSLEENALPGDEEMLARYRQLGTDLIAAASRSESTVTSDDVARMRATCRKDSTEVIDEDVEWLKDLLGRVQKIYSYLRDLGYENQEIGFIG